MTEEITNLIIQYENGTITQGDEISLFQYLVDSKAISNLQGHYFRHAIYLMQLGLVKLNEEDLINGQEIY